MQGGVWQDEDGEKGQPAGEIADQHRGGNYFAPAVQDFNSLIPIGGDRQLFDKLLW